MRIILVIVLLGLTPCLVRPQDADQLRRADEVRQAVGKIAGSKKAKAKIVLNDLRELEGTIVGVYADSFAFAPKEKDKALITLGSKQRKKVTVFYKYEDVMQLEGKGVLLSFVPDPMQTPYSSWDKLRAIGPGEFLQVHLTNGKRAHGVFLRHSDDKLVLVRGNTEADVFKEHVSRVYRVSGDTSTLTSKLLSGGQKGTEISDGIFPITDPSAHAYPGTLAIGAAVGALLYVLPHGGTKRVLAFAK